MGKIENDVFVDERYKDSNDDTEIKPMIRLTLKKSDKFFGPGVATLLHQIDKHGSIQMACQEMGMSYSKAWKILKRADSELGYALLHSKNGGIGGGESILTEKGKKFLETYDYVTDKLRKEAAKLFEQEFKTIL